MAVVSKQATGRAARGVGRACAAIERGIKRGFAALRNRNQKAKGSPSSDGSGHAPRAAAFGQGALRKYH